MKKLGVIVVLGLGLISTSMFAERDQYGDERAAYSTNRHDSLEYQIHHLQRMLSHVRWQIREYRANWRIRREVEDISREVNRVTWKFRHGDYNRFRLRRQVERLHDRLHAVEDTLHVRSRDYYRWD